MLGKECTPHFTASAKLFSSWQWQTLSPTESRAFHIARNFHIGPSGEYKIVFHCDFIWHFPNENAQLLTRQSIFSWASGPSTLALLWNAFSCLLPIFLYFPYWLVQLHYSFCILIYYFLPCLWTVLLFLSLVFGGGVKFLYNLLQQIHKYCLVPAGPTPFSPLPGKQIPVLSEIF